MKSADALWRFPRHCKRPCFLSTETSQKTHCSIDTLLHCPKMSTCSSQSTGTYCRDQVVLFSTVSPQEGNLWTFWVVKKARLWSFSSWVKLWCCSYPNTKLSFQENQTALCKTGKSRQELWYLAQRLMGNVSNCYNLNSFECCPKLKVLEGKPSCGKSHDLENNVAESL